MLRNSTWYGYLNIEVLKNRGLCALLGKKRLIKTAYTQTKLSHSQLHKEIDGESSGFPVPINSYSPFSGIRSILSQKQQMLSALW